jgi:hypothetical protein
MPADVRSFNAKINAFAATVPKHANGIKAKLAMQLLERIVLMTPVDTGRARANWVAALDDPFIGIVTKNSKGGQGAISRGVRIIERVTGGQSIWISNNLPYIERLEHGYSGQAPGGMIAIALAEVGSQFQ